ncbi:MAG TPA: tetratricopeptide repeat protein [Thermoanaerobaculia bacterium]
MVHRHYDEEALIALLHSGADAISSDPHLAGCSSCADTLDSYRAIVEVLGEEAVWDLREAHQDEAARGAASLRSIAEAMHAEHESAADVVAELLKSPRQWWVATVLRDERYQTAGAARRLIEVSESKIDTMPPDAIEAAAAAVAIVGGLDETNAVLQLSGAAYRQHAYALFYTGEFNRALESIEAAQQIFDRCVVSEYEIARLDIVRALVYRGQERYNEALELARKSANVFAAFGDRQRLASALMTEAYLLMFLHNFRDALPILTDIDQQFAQEIDLDTRARTIHNIAGCQYNLGRIPDALNSFQLAAALFDELGNETEAARIRYNVAVVLTEQGRHDEAKRRMRAARSDFERLGMVDRAAVAGLDLAEFALLENNFKEVEDLCRAAIRQFEASGVPYSSDALTALTFLREAAEQRRATQEIVWHVKTYIKRLPDEPALLFAPAPLPPA